MKLTKGQRKAKKAFYFACKFDRPGMHPPMFLPPEARREWRLARARWRRYEDLTGTGWAMARKIPAKRREKLFKNTDNWESPRYRSIHPWRVR